MRNFFEKSPGVGSMFRRVRHIYCLKKKPLFAPKKCGKNKLRPVKLSLVKLEQSKSNQNDVENEHVF